jgi:hypothetical protein
VLLLTEKSALLPVEFGTAADLLGADRSTSGVNFVAVRVILFSVNYTHQEKQEDVSGKKRWKE